jgi:mannose-6-phosphate isomerase-like protein (cupin superfamily)
MGPKGDPDQGLKAGESTMVSKVNLADKFAWFQEYYKPKIVGDLNDSYLKLVKIKGEFVWHQHHTEDELFLVVKGRLLIKLRDGDVWLDPGKFVVIPRGVEHCPFAEDEAQVILLEPKSTLNTGEVRNERTVAQLDWV